MVYILCPGYKLLVTCYLLLVPVTCYTHTGYLRCYLYNSFSGSSNHSLLLSPFRIHLQRVEDTHLDLF